MKNKKRKLSDGLERLDKTQVHNYRPLVDRDGRYIPFCDFHCHRGISLTSELCEERGCHHYRKLYIRKGTRLK